MPDTKHARRLLQIAKERDIAGMKAVLALYDFPIEAFGFWAQQAVEKTLKAWLAALDVQYPLIHDLDKLLNCLEQTGAKVEPWMRSLAYLTPFAVQFRYEAAPAGEYDINRESLIREIERLVQHVSEVLPDD